MHPSLYVIKEAQPPKTAGREGLALCGWSIVFGLLFFVSFFCRSKRKKGKTERMYELKYFTFFLDKKGDQKIKPIR